MNNITTHSHLTHFPRCSAGLNILFWVNGAHLCVLVGWHVGLFELHLTCEKVLLKLN